MSGGCSHHDDAAPAGGGAILDAPSRIDGPIHLDAPCTVTVDAPALLPANHVAVGSTIDYDSNPPSSGPHYPIWAAFQTYASPVPRPYYVHDLEHGAVVFVYKCTADDGCPDVVRALQQASDALPSDPICDPSSGVRVRTIVTPDPLLDVPVAATAWGWVYKADCVDVPTLTQFAKDHYGQGPEQICSNGTTQF